MMSGTSGLDAGTVREWFAAEFEKELAKLESESGVPVAEFRQAGRANAKETVDWWHVNGARFCGEYVQWLKSTDWSLAVFDGALAAELRIMYNTGEGAPPVLMFIDAVFQTGDGELVVVDYKTGKNDPHPLQLGLYAAGIEAAHGVRPKWGFYYMTRKGGLTAAHDLSRFTQQYWRTVVSQFAHAREAGIFVPAIQQLCGYCSVSKHCVTFNPDADGLFDRIGTDTAPPTYELPEHVSHSQITQWAQCGKQYELQRLAGVAESPAVWLPGGTAVHTVFEKINKTMEGGNSE